jgi:pilus assembly protein CpaB
VKKRYLRSETMPATSAPSSALAGVADAAIGSNAVAESDIAPGQIVLREAFGTEAAKTGALTIPKGLIALSVQLSLPGDVAGYVVPGSQVIIFLTSKLDTKDPKLKLSNGDDLTITKTLMPRVNVLATTSAPATAAAGATTNADGGATNLILTLAVSQQDAERLVNSQKVGELYLGLLSSGSKVAASDPGVVNAGIFRPVPVFVK